MANQNILEEYLVKLGSVQDVASFARFNSILKDSENAVGKFTVATVKGFAKLEVAIVGAFVSAGTSLLTLADKTAMADQQFNLMGTRMLMTKNSFRALQSALDTLGVSLSDIVTDRTGELNAEFQDLYERNIKLGKSLGPGFDASMVGIRKIRVEVRQMGTEFEFLTFGVISKLFEKLGGGTGDIWTKLRKLNDYISENLPNWADEVATRIVPVWNDFTTIMKTLGHDTEAVALHFTNMIGELSGDQSIEGSTFKFDNFAKALDHVANAMTDIITITSKLLGTTFHGLSASGDTIITGVRNAIAQYHLARANALKQQGDTAGYNKMMKLYHQDQTWAGKDWENANNESIKAYSKYFTKPLESNFGSEFGKGSFSSDKLTSLISSAASQYGIDPALLAAIIKQESGGISTIMGPKTKSGQHAAGLMQLMPQTATQYGVNDVFDPTQNVNAGAHYFSDLLKKYGGDTSLALEAYNWGPNNTDKYKDTGKMPAETRSYIDSILAMQNKGEASKGQIIIQSMSITVPPNTPKEDIKTIMVDSLVEFLRKRDRNTMAQTAAGAYY